MLWLTLNYPRDPPITYVVPNSDMLVKPSSDVEISGRCQMGYLKDWERKSEVRRRRAFIVKATVLIDSMAM